MDEERKQRGRERGLNRERQAERGKVSSATREVINKRHRGKL